VLTEHAFSGRGASPTLPIIVDETKKEYRKGKPARLDLSKLFPKPRGAEGQHYGNALLSPTKMVNSPAAMSMVSEYFPGSTTKLPTSQIGGQTRLQTTARHHNAAVQSPTSPVRKFEKDEFDSAKVHVRRPPKGVQHWFDALDEDSSDESPEDTQHVHAPRTTRSNDVSTGPTRGSTASQTTRERATSHYDPQLQDSMSGYRKDTFALDDIVDITHLTSPSQFSVDTYHSQVSSKTKESAMSKTNLQDSSVLSFSSSEDEIDGGRSKARRVAVRKSLDMTDYAGDIVIGQAQAYEVRPQQRRPSAGRASLLSTSTNATIEVMYTPEPPIPPYHYQRSSNHMRQPSVIPEDEDTRPSTAINMPLSPTAHSVMSARTSASAPQPHLDGSHKLMEVTAEEEALLELMRKKRAAMNKQCALQVDTSVQEYDRRQKTPLERSQPPRRTSAFLSMSLESSPVRVVEARPRQRASANAPSPLLLPRGRSVKAIDDSNVGMSHLRDSTASDMWSDRHYSPASRGRLPHYLPTPSEFSPLDLFPPNSPTPAASATSPTTTDHPSSLPSPITPGLYIGETDVAVKVASSDTSNELEDMVVLDNGVIGAPRDSTKSGSSRELNSHRRCRTASSDAEIAFPAPPSHSFKDLVSLSEASSHPPSIVEPPAPKLPRKTPRHISELALAADSRSRSRQSSVHSTGSRTSAYSQASSYLTGPDPRRSRHVSRASSFTSNRRVMKDDRNSVSDDVLAAWNSLGGTY
jgi:hypothetical protein